MTSTMRGIGMGVAALVISAAVVAAADDPMAIDKAADAAVNYLKSTQAENGSWGGAVAPGLTGIVTTGLLKGGKLSPDDKAVAKALTYIESLVDSKDGSIAGKESRIPNYATSVNVMALTAADPEGKKYKAVVKGAGDFLKTLQWDEEEGKKPEDALYGGAGYKSGSRSDLSNTHFFLDALKAAGVPKDDPVWKRAVIFVSRCQNLKSEHNTLEFAARTNDGSFIYNPGETRGDPGKDGAKPGYGSMTYAGLKSLALCGVSRDDERYKKAFEWIQKNYTVDGNPGMPSGQEKRGHFYYLMAMAKCLDALGVDEITDAAGKKHDWRAEIAGVLVATQRKDGSWLNETNAWMEGNPDLCTAYALITLSYCRPKAR